MFNQEIEYTYSEIEEFILNNKSNDALKLLVFLLNNNKTDVEKVFEKALIYFYIDADLEKTLNELDLILKMDPDYMEALLLKGQILAGLHLHNRAIKTFNMIHPKALPYEYKKLIEYISEYNHRSTDYYNVYDFDSYFVYFFIESQNFNRFIEVTIHLLQSDVIDEGLIWQNLNMKSYEAIRYNVPLISGIRLSDEEPNAKIEYIEEKKCIVCGKKLKKNQKNLCKSCFKKQYASRIIKKLVSIVKPRTVFKKEDLKSLNLDDIQIQDYIWTLQEFDLIEVDNNKLKLKDEKTLNKFRVNSKMDPIDFNIIDEENRLDKTCKICDKTLPVSQFYKSSEGYEDTCKNCKKLTVTARYLEDVIQYVGFENEFVIDDLNEYISNQNQIMGMIWSLQDNDLLIENDDKKYILADKSRCLDFLQKYDANYDVNGVDIKPMPKSKSKSKSNVQDDLDTSDILSKLKKGKKSKTHSKEDNERKQMEFVLKLLRKGKSRHEVAQFTELDESTFTLWYDQGKANYSENTIYFYNEIQKIKNKEFEKNKAKKLRVQIKEFIPKFTELENKINQVNVKSNNLISIGEEINYNLNILKGAYRFRKVEKLENILSNATGVYADLNKRINEELISIHEKEKNRIKELRVQIKEFILKFTELDNKIVEIDHENNALNSVRKEIKQVIDILNSEYHSNKIDNLKKNLSYARCSYYKLNKAITEELANIENEEKIKLLKVDIDEFINKFMVLDDRIERITLRSPELYTIRKEIKRNINLLNYAYGLKLLNKLENILSNARKSYDELFEGFNEELKKYDELKKYSDSLLNIERKFSSNILMNNLNHDELEEINEKIYHEISILKLKSKKEVYNRFKDLLKENSLKKSNKLLEEFYKDVGKTNFSDLFLEKLSDNDLNEDTGNYIRGVVECKIKDYSIKDKNEIDREINKVLNDENNRQKRSLNKLNEIFTNDNIYLKGLSYNDEEKIKEILIKSIKDNRLDYLSVYPEFKHVVEEFRKTNDIVDNEVINEMDEKNKVGGLLSKIKRFFVKE